MDKRRSVFQLSDVSGVNALRAKITIARLTQLDQPFQASAEIVFLAETTATSLAFRSVGGSGLISVTNCSGMLEPDRTLRSCSGNAYDFAPQVGQPFYLFAQWTDSGRVSIRLSMDEGITDSPPPVPFYQFGGDENHPLQAIEFHAASMEAIFENLEIGTEGVWQQ